LKTEYIPSKGYKRIVTPMERPAMKLRLRTPDQILQVALAKEKEARDFYD
jgi:rubrerythrin